MKKFLCCFLAIITLCAGMATSLSCGNANTKESDASVLSAPSSAEEKVSLSLKRMLYNLEDGQSAALQIEFTINGAEGDLTALTFTSNAPTIATVSEDGVVTGVAEGKTTVIVAYGETSVKATIKVTQREYKIELSEEYLILPINAEKQLTATAYYGKTELTDATLAWTSSAPSVISVENGLIKALGEGRATLTVATEKVSATVQVFSVKEATEEQVNTFNEEYVNIYGRSYFINDSLNLDHAANGIEVGFVGSSLQLTMNSTNKGYMRVFVDDNLAGRRMELSAGLKDYTVAGGLEEGYHLVRIVKCTEEQQNAYWSIQGFHADAFFAAPKKSELKIEFIGDSITAGHGSIGSYGQQHTVDNSDASMAYAYLTAKALQADYSIVAYSGICTKAYHWLTNLNMATLYERISNRNSGAYAFDFDADIVVLNLGTNEASYLNTSNGASYGGQFPVDYQAFLATVREKHPNAHIICLYGMGGVSPLIRTGIQTAIANMADTNIVFNPFEIISDSSGGNNHPGSTAHQTWANDLTAYIQTLL